MLRFHAPGPEIELPLSAKTIPVEVNWIAFLNQTPVQRSFRKTAGQLRIRRPDQANARWRFGYKSR
jgi:hypothetical protein